MIRVNFTNFLSSNFFVESLRFSSASLVCRIASPITDCVLLNESPISNSLADLDLLQCVKGVWTVIFETKRFYTMVIVKQFVARSTFSLLWSPNVKNQLVISNFVFKTAFAVKLKIACSLGDSL